MKGIIALESMNSVREAWLTEADAAYASLTESPAPGSGTGRTPRRSVSSGWLAAAVCLTVGIGVYLAILAFGGGGGSSGPVGTRGEETRATERDSGTSVTETESHPETDTDAESMTTDHTETTADANETGTEAPTGAETETPLPPESGEQAAVRSIMASLRTLIDGSAYATQEMYVIRPQGDGKESSTGQLWARDTTGADDRFYSLTRSEQGYAASGTPNEITMIGDTLYYARAVGVNGRQSKMRNTLTGAQQASIRAEIDRARMPLPTSDFGEFSWITDAAMGHTYIYITVGRVSDALLARLLTAAGYDPVGQSVTVTELTCAVYFEVKEASSVPQEWEPVENVSLHTRLTMTASSGGKEEKLIFDIQEYGLTDARRHITEPENAYGGYSTEKGGEVLTADVMKLFHPDAPYEERTMYVTASALKVRSSPQFGGDGNVIGYLKAGDAVIVTGETDTYYIIRHEGYPAYVGRTYLSYDKP